MKGTNMPKGKTVELHPTTDIGRRLFTYLQRNPMSAARLSTLIGITSSSVLRIIRGHSEPRIEVRMKIEKFLREEELTR